MFDTATSRAPALNAAQRGAVDHDGGPLLIVAGAGTGKTMTLACRVARLIEKGTAPERILLLTFTRRAAREMLARATRLTEKDAAGRAWGGTFHSVANRLLRMHGRALGLPPNFTVMDTSDAADLMNLMRSELGFATKERRFPKKDTLATIYSRTVNAMRPLDEVLHEHFPWCRDELDDIATLFEQYTRHKRSQFLLDFDDLLLFWHALAEADGVGQELARMFDHILVDEYQDTNGLQADILAAMRKGHPGVTVVGDDAQAIYSFRNATIRNILEFPKRFPGTTIVTLEENYRSTRQILDASNAVIARSVDRYSKELYTRKADASPPELLSCTDESHQSDLVCRNVLEHRERGRMLMDQAVLFRAGHHSAALEIELTRRNIPFVKYGGLKFLEAAHIKDLLAMLRILENPYDEPAWFRALQLVEGIGQATARRVMQELGVRRGEHAPEDEASPLERLRVATPTVPGAARDGFIELKDALIDAAAPDLDASPGAQVERLTKFYERPLFRLYDSGAARFADVEQMQRIASGFPSRSRFIAELTIEPPQVTGDFAVPPSLDEDYLILSTIHSAKGCEWDVVHVIHAADGMIPSDMAVGDEEGVDEERRLFYVALTRAKEMLYVYWPLRYYHRHSDGLSDAHGFSQLTRFIDKEVRKLFEEPIAAIVPPDPQPVNHASIASVDAVLARLWKTKT
jgi:DNA helicase II / ATP-dependent DNA helicase PcrA